VFSVLGLVGLYWLVLTGCASQPANNTPLKDDAPLVENTPSSDPVKLAAFNVQIFGVSKMGKPEVVATLVDILGRYDIVLIQEIRDASETAIHELLSQLNAKHNGAYELLLAPRAGRTSSKEQYAFIYKSEAMTVLSSYTYDDGIEPDADTFEREPFVVYADIKGLTVNLIPIHTKPDDAVAEISALVAVYDDARTRSTDDDAILMGDFNADCSYVSASDWNNIALKTDQRFEWLIDLSVDTTVKTTDCTYNHFVITDTLQTKVQTGSAKVFDFAAAYGMTTDKADDVSDHYPIEMILQP